MLEGRAWTDFNIGDALWTAIIYLLQDPLSYVGRLGLGFVGQRGGGDGVNVRVVNSSAQ
jgi:hypothetical protein